MSNRTLARALANLPPAKYSQTRLGGGVTPQGIAFTGGLDQLTPTLQMPPGSLRDVLNFECSLNGGYGRIEGYERFDGQDSPSDASYVVVQVDAFTTVPAVGDEISQAGSGATGTVAAVNDETGATYMVVTQVTGTFNYTGVVSDVVSSLTVTAANSPFTVTAANSPYTIPHTGSTIGTAITPTVALTSQQRAQYTADAADIYRDLIGAVPGSGSILGVVAMTFSGVNAVYAFRANEGNTLVKLYKSSAAGWVLVPFFNTLGFVDGGTSEPVDGETITQGAVTATIKRTMWQSGSFDDDSAVGTFVVTTPAAGNFAPGLATTASGSTVLLTGGIVPITLLPGGRFEFVKGNFSGQAITRRVYGCDGVNKAFEFDGTTLAPISTGLSPDAPSHIAFHKNFLFVSQASSFFHCGVGTPFKWGADDGGGEIATGDVVTAMLSLPGSSSTAALAVYLRSQTAILYGTDPETFNFVLVPNVGTGALPYSVQNLSDTYALGDLGVVALQTSLNYGNFTAATLTKNILPFILQQRYKTTASCVDRIKGQYRLFFSDGYALWLTIANQQYLGAGVVLFPNPVFCCDTDDSNTAGAATYFGSSDGLGYVYQMEAGTSFDGEEIDAYITLAWDFIKSPSILKRFRSARIEIASNGYAALNFGYQLGYGSTNIGQPATVGYASGFNPAIWDSFTWDAFTWDGQTLLPTDADMDGVAENVSVTISSGTNYIPAYTINSLIMRYSMYRGLR